MYSKTNPIRVFSEHPVAANLLMLLMILGGVWGLKNLNTQKYPTQTFTRVAVNVSWPGASAEDVAALVTLPIELKLRNLNNLDELSSKTGQGYSYIEAEFKAGTKMEAALEEVKQQIDLLRNLPQDIEKPVIYRAKRKEAVASVVVSLEGELADLIPIVRDYEQQLLSRGIEEVQLNGLPQQEVAIQLTTHQLKKIGMSLPELAQKINLQSQDLPAGTIGYGQTARQLRSLDQARSSRSFKQIVIKNSDQGPLIRLGDISVIEQRVGKGQQLLHIDGRPAIEMLLLQTSASDTIIAAQILENWLQDVSVNLTSSIHISVSREVWRFLQDTMGLLINNGLQGLVLVVLILYLFLNGQVATWVALGIPVTLLAAFVLFAQLFDGSINLISLVAFVVALGIIVDDAIVVGEDALTQRQQGLSALAAAQTGANRMFSPVMSSSLTTLAAFLPLLLIPGPFGEITAEVPQVLCCVIIASLLECFLVLPKHLEYGLKIQPPVKNTGLHRFKQAAEKGLLQLRDSHFMPLLQKCINNKAATLSAAVFMFLLALSLMATQRVGFALGVDADIEYIQANVQFRNSSSHLQRSDYVEQLKLALEKINEGLDLPVVTQILIKENVAFFAEEQKQGVQYSSIEVEVVGEKQRDISLRQLVQRWRAAAPNSSIVDDFHIKAFDADRYKGAFSLLLKSNDTAQLKAGAQRLKQHILAQPGVVSVFDDLPYGNERWIYKLNASAKQLGLTSFDLGRQIRAAYQGQRLQIFNDNSEELEVKVMLVDQQRYSLASLAQLPIKTPNGTMLPLSTLASITSELGIDVIRHHNAQQRVRVQAFVDPTQANSLAMASDIQQNVLPEILEQYNLTSELGEYTRRSKEQLGLMALGGVYALLLIYIILAWFFASFSWPLAVMSAIPLALTGAITGHWVMGYEYGTMSFLGTFTLIGIIINDSIVLIRHYRDNKPDFASLDQINQSIINAAQRRFRPVVLTSLTTMAGLTPLMFDQSSTSAFFVPIALTIFFGLAYGTLLVLIVIPCLLVVIEQIQLKRRLRQGLRLQDLKGSNA